MKNLRQDSLGNEMQALLKDENFSMNPVCLLSLFHLHRPLTNTISQHVSGPSFTGPIHDPYNLYTITTSQVEKLRPRTILMLGEDLTASLIS